MIKITEAEKRSIMFYQGSVGNIVVDKESKHLKDFFEIQNAYEVLNTLLFPGIENEKNRVKEGRFLNTKLLEYMSEVLRVYEELYSAMCKYTFFIEKKKSLYTYRKDRANSWDYLKDGNTYSFLSTSLKRGLTADTFIKKEGILLLEMECLGTIEHLDVNDVLGEDNIYAEENEVLFAPFLYFEENELELTEAERKLLDVNNEPPRKKYRLNLKGSLIRTLERYEYEVILRETEQIREKILKRSSVENAKNVLQKLQKEEKIDEIMEQKYILWKKDVQLYLKMQYAKIKTQVLNCRKNEDRRKAFSQELEGTIKVANGKREKYDKQLTVCSTLVSIFQPLMVLAISISFIEQIEVWMKVTSILLSTGCLIISGICKSLSLDGKSMKWTTTFLRLDELEREYSYHKDCNEEELEGYIKRFMDIIVADDIMCEKNMKSLVEHFEYINSQNEENS